MRKREKLIQLFEKLEVDPSLDSFANRKLLQKLTYLIEVFGIDLGFRFSWYLHGPYDRNLTAVLYDDRGGESEIEIQDQFPQEDEKLAKLKKFLGRDIYSSRTLELIVSLHYLNHVGKKSGMCDDEIVSELLHLKPHFTREEATYYLKRINELVETDTIRY